MNDLHWFLAVFELTHLNESTKDSKTHEVHYSISDVHRVVAMRETTGTEYVSSRND